MNHEEFDALKQLRAVKHLLTVQQYKTLRGQVQAGDGDGAMKGLRKLLMQKGGR